MKTTTAVFLCLALAECTPNDKAVYANAETPPCHDPVKVRKENTRIIFTTCSGNETELLLSEITGPKGPAGDSGERGPAGQNAADEVIDWCRHDPRDHVNRTVRVKISEAVKRFGGYNGALDYPGKCGETENTCVCDACDGNPSVHHYLTGDENEPF